MPLAHVEHLYWVLTLSTERVSESMICGKILSFIMTAAQWKTISIPLERLHEDVRHYPRL